jgi:hypothetical protein
MTLLGKAAVAMWWDIAPAQRAEFEDWHTHEHFPERMSIPGFMRGSRWANVEGTDGFFVLYELDQYETLTSRDYLSRLNDPTTWSTKMMPHHRNMVRSQCRVTDSFGGGIARSMMTLRLSPKPGDADALHRYLQDVLSRIPTRPGLTGAHLLYTQTPEIGPTQEQKIRGGTDAVADWIVLVSGYDTGVLSAFAASELSDHGLSRAGAAPDRRRSHFELAYSLARTDI